MRAAPLAFDHDRPVALVSAIVHAIGRVGDHERGPHARQRRRRDSALVESPQASRWTPSSHTSPSTVTARSSVGGTLSSSSRPRAPRSSRSMSESEKPTMSIANPSSVNAFSSATSSASSHPAFSASRWIVATADGYGERSKQIPDSFLTGPSAFAGHNSSSDSD
jgi:hypothetical protein